MAGVGGMRIIKRRLKVAQSTQQITKAMQLIAASKLRRAEPQMRRALSYYEGLIEVLGAAVSADYDRNLVLASARDSGDILVLLMSGDRGLCGAYNDAVVRKGIEAAEGSKRFIVIGLRGRDKLSRAGITPGPGDFHEANRLTILAVKRLSESIVERFLQDTSIRTVRLVYTHYYSALSHDPVIEDLLPVRLPAPSGPEPLSEPDTEALITGILPAIVEARIYSAVMMSVAAEHSARRMTMSSATDNAQDMIDNLRRMYNRERQTAITSEIIDIVGGAEIVGG
ncbi:MAG: ATP synthase F1 subunit gamma [bacterium]|nr:ATP synthase F1 subunit gamma [bacterium]